MSANDNLYAHFAAALDASRACIETPDGGAWNGADIARYSARAANALRAHGLAPGDRVSVIAEKSLEYLWLYLGCLRAGLVFHPLNPAYTARELGFFLGDAGTRLLVSDPALAARVDPAAAACESLSGTLTLGAEGSGSFADACADSDDEAPVCPRTGDDTAALLYSSGTTGTPKGIRITHRNLYSNACALREAWGFSADDILLHALPVFHVHGLFITLGPAFLAGTRVRLLPRFDADAVIDALPGATLFAGVPTYYTRLLANPRFTREACRDVRVFISGSAPLSEATFYAFEERTGQRILERYGMTETGINTSNPLSGARKPGAVGPPLPGVGLRIVTGDGRPCANGEIGEIEVRGENVFPGYWQLPEATAAAFDAHGWFRTGDQGHLDDDGYLFIVGRSKDLVISGGLNVYPKEVERELEAIPGIGEAAVFGVPHADFGEAVVAAVVADAPLDEAAVLATLRERLATFKVPKRVLVGAELPRNAMGKVQKNVLREQHAGLFAARP